ncbi:flagellar protein FlaG [Alteribacter natronophilus]|uniref:flagellar protein FlaG n=1 Tax=Alteribacter natronophilus TaxID=2583810 RepID=UPI00110F0889|nr:flagellar protein FlaG [Alteribacter natronophilus]TMW72381.1 flagellar biosynthesis protein FlaG [Alteribacter natronophilus]
MEISKSMIRESTDRLGYGADKRVEPVTQKGENRVQEDVKNGEPQRTAGKEEVLEKAEALNQMLEAQDKAYRFNIHEDLNRTYVAVVDRNTEEVIKEIPPEKFLDMVSAMLEFAGIIIDEKI